MSKLDEKTLSLERVEEEPKGLTLKQVLVSHIRRTAIEIINLLLGYNWVYWLIGLANKKLGWIESVFLVYPANDDYALAYVYARRLPKIEWKPWFIGIFWENGKYGVKFAISAHNGHFRDPANKERMRGVVDRMEELRKLFCAKRKTFAGTLPGILFAKRMLRETHEADVTVGVVVKAIEKVKLFDGLRDDIPIVILGGRGFIGRRVVASLPKENVYCVDIANGNGTSQSKTAEWPSHLKGQRVILVNIALNSALDGYLDRLWPGIVVVNEVYPEPSPETEKRLRSIGCVCYHIVGVRGGALPSFPHGYHGGIPCCAAWPSGQMEALLFKVI